jgi:NAD(P)-dependent dehydrogenase (short-subunit alcohol dehydrogenase family)
MRIAIVQGTRPEIIKNYSIVKALSDAGTPFEVLHTNQHHAECMSGSIYRELGYMPSRSMPGNYRIGLAIVVNIGSTSGRIAGAFVGPYCGAKFALEAITLSLREELRSSGVSVHMVEPGVSTHRCGTRRSRPSKPSRAKECLLRTERITATRSSADRNCCRKSSIAPSRPTP